MDAASTRRPAWVAMIAFALVAGVTQILWLTYAPVTDAAAAHYGVSVTAVGWLANVFPLWYVVLAIPAGLALDRWLRPIVLLGGSLTAVGAIVRVLGDGYGVALAGQSLVAIAQPLVLTAITPMAAHYLAPKDRPKGIAAASAATFAGMIVAFLLGTVLDLSAALAVQAVVGALAVVFLALALRTRPTFLPGDPSGGLGDFAQAWRNPTVRRMCLLVPIPFGAFTALTTWAETLLAPAGISADTAGILLILVVAAGVVGCAFIPVWAVKERRERLVMLVGVLVTAVGCAVLAFAPSVGTAGVTFPLTGLLLLPALPIVLEISERTSGRSAGAAAGLVWLAGQLGALVITGVVGLLVDSPLPAFLLLAVVTLVALLALPRPADTAAVVVADPGRGQ